MILVCTDTHSYFGYINDQIEYAERILGVQVSSVIHLGDFGIYKSELHNFFIKLGQRFLRPVYFIEGNHEDFETFPWLVKDYGDFFTHLPRGAITHIDGYRFLSLGGAAYMDAMITQQGAVIKDCHIDECLAITPEEVDIVLTHDCPTGIGVPNSPGLGHYGQTGFPRSQELAAHFKPKIWLFGHHHKWYEHGDRHSVYYGLAEIWKGFGLLDRDYQFKIIRHPLEKEEEQMSFIDRALIRLKIINR